MSASGSRDNVAVVCLVDVLHQDDPGVSGLKVFV
jgi:hypothetical protein